MCQKWLIQFSHITIARKLLAARDPLMGKIANALYQRMNENKAVGHRENHFTIPKIKMLLLACHEARWIKHLISAGLDKATDVVREAALLTQSGQYSPSMRWKPWGLEIIGPTVREDVNGGQEGYTMKLLVLVGPLSRQLHENYDDGHGVVRHAKTETQTVVFGTYQLGLGEDPRDSKHPEEILTLHEGETYHVAAGTVHQPMVAEGNVAIILEVSKPNIGPGSTTRLFDPNERMRKIGDI